MFREQARKRLTKKAKKGFRGFPVATVAFYGPDNRRASKLTVGIVLVLQPGFMGESSPLPMAAASALLMASPPVRPRQNRPGIGRASPHQTPKQAAHLRYRQRQQRRLEIHAGLSPRTPPCGWRPGTHRPAWPA